MSERLVAMGVDGARAGWIAALLWSDGTSSRTELRLLATIDEIAEARRDGAVVAIDVPIGLTGDATLRACDREARARLGRRRSTVFAPPARWMLEFADDYAALREAVEGKRASGVVTNSLSAQAHGILAKIKSVDDWLGDHPGADGWLVECHPEVCFAALNGGAALAEPKTTGPGRAARAALLLREFPDSRAAVDGAGWLRSQVAVDDMLDAYAGLHAAAAFSGGAHEMLGDGAIDERGRPMRMVVGPVAGADPVPAVTLRPTTPADIEFCMAVERDPEARPFISNSTRAQHLELIDGGGDHLMIEADGEPAGFMIVKAVDETRAVELGRLVVAGRGRGIGGRALALVVDHVFGTRPTAHRFWLDVLPRNERAHRAYLRAGFIDEGVLRDAWIGPAGTFETLQIMSILRPEWEARRRPA